MYMTSTLSFEPIQDFDSLQATQDISYTFKVKVFDTINNNSYGSLTLTTTYSTILHEWLDFSYVHSANGTGEYNTIVGTLTGTPLNEHVGDHDIMLYAAYEDFTNAVSIGYTITIINTNDPVSGFVTIDGICLLYTSDAADEP